MTDWKEMIARCEAGGWSRKAIAEYCGLAYTSLCDIAKGHTTEPKGMAAVKLHELASRIPPVKAKAAA